MNYLDEMFNVIVDYNQDCAGNIFTTITRGTFKQVVIEALEKQKKDLLTAILQESESPISVHLQKDKLIKIFGNTKLEEQENE